MRPHKLVGTQRAEILALLADGRAMTAAEIAGDVCARIARYQYKSVKKAVSRLGRENKLEMLPPKRTPRYRLRVTPLPPPPRRTHSTGVFAKPPPPYEFRPLRWVDIPVPRPNSYTPRRDGIVLGADPNWARSVSGGEL